MTKPQGPGANRARTWAKRHGFAPPLAWDDIDDPDEKPNYGERADHHARDEAVIERFLGGEFKLPTTRPERVEIIRRWPGGIWDETVMRQAP